MPTLTWLGRDAVTKHKVPFRLLQDVPEMACGETGSGNLLVEGDNLEALKALLPYYAGQVKVIYIDPPYNTGNEGWVFNDKVNGPTIREWGGKAVGREFEDYTRHDKWLCMMYPRLRIFKELLSRDGLLAVSIDDNEVSFLGVILDELFGSSNRLACAPWLAEPSGGKQKTSLRNGHEYLLIYHNGDPSKLSRESKSTGELDRKDKYGKYRKGRELLKWGAESLREDREDMWFPVRAPDGSAVYPIRNDGKEGRWRLGSKNPLVLNLAEDPEHAHWEVRPFNEGVVVDGKTERLVPYEKIRDAKKSFGWTTWLDSFGFNADGTRELKDIFGSKDFDTPKPTQLIEWVVSLHGDEDALVLDSFAGSGTTGHAVLSLNKADGGNRRFILIEMEPSIARSITAERIRRVSCGYTNSKAVKVEGLGSGFRFCELGDSLFDKCGKIKKTVKFADLARHVYFSETGEPLPYERMPNSPLLGVHRNVGIYLLYNGILGDKTAAGGNVLTRRLLAHLPEFDGQKVIYCAGCLIDGEELAKLRIGIRQTPYKIRTS